jgi:hypothetical protein
MAPVGLEFGSPDFERLDSLKWSLQKEFQVIADKWEVTEEERNALLGDWQDDRLRKIIGIHVALEMLLPPERAHVWVKAPNEYFQGKTALDHMLGFNDDQGITDVERYLQSVLWSK